MNHSGGSLAVGYQGAAGDRSSGEAGCAGLGSKPDPAGPHISTATFVASRDRAIAIGEEKTVARAATTACPR